MASVKRRSREGAWIEIKFNRSHGLKTTCRSREGAWIEIRKRQAKMLPAMVAPARERGLKFLGFQPFTINHSSRSREGAWIEIDVLDFYWPSFASLPRGSVD